MTRQIEGLCGAILLVLAGHVSAATTWTLNTGTVSGNNSSTTATSTAWANTGSGSPVNSQVIEQQTAPNNFVLYTGGLGINNLDGCAVGGSCGDPGDVQSTAPEHAIDNEQRYEMVRLKFTDKVNLTGVSFGWIGSDSDYTILAYTPTVAQAQPATPNSLAGQTWGSLQTGWTVIGNYANATLNTVLSTNNTSAYSSYWLIGAYNPLAGGNAGFAANGYDYLKLKTVVGNVQPITTTQVPEPASLALVGLALVGMLYTRQRRWVPAQA